MLPNCRWIGSNEGSVTVGIGTKYLASGARRTEGKNSGMWRSEIGPTDTGRRLAVGSSDTECL